MTIAQIHDLAASVDVCLLKGCGDIAKPGLGLAIEKFLDDELGMGRSAR